MALDELARRFALSNWKKKDDAQQIFDSGRQLVLVKPWSFMNTSGIPVRLIASWYKVPPEEILVIYDEMDIPFGSLRMRAKGGHGGHNGMRSIIGTCGENFPRIRAGVGRPENDSIDHLLSRFSPAEELQLPKLIDGAVDGAQKWLDAGIELAMQFVNTLRPLGEPADNKGITLESP